MTFVQTWGGWVLPHEMRLAILADGICVDSFGDIDIAQSIAVGSEE
jgi:hypothetical protein